jgi:hypothetical protein
VVSRRIHHNTVTTVIEKAVSRGNSIAVQAAIREAWKGTSKLAALLGIKAATGAKTAPRVTDR